MFRRVLLEKSNILAINFARSHQIKESFFNIKNLNNLVNINKNLIHTRCVSNYKNSEINVKNLFKESVSKFN